MTNEKTSPPVTKDPRQQVSGPAIGLLVTGIIMAFWDVIYLVLTIIGASVGPLMREGYGRSYAGGPWQFLQGAVGVVVILIGLAAAGFIIFASLKMKELNQYAICMAASIVVMIPCLSFPCCVVGVPIGIWCLVILMKPEVKAAFH